MWPCVRGSPPAQRPEEVGSLPGWGKGERIPTLCGPTREGAGPWRGCRGVGGTSLQRPTVIGSPVHTTPPPAPWGCTSPMMAICVVLPCGMTPGLFSDPQGRDPGGAAVPAHTCTCTSPGGRLTPQLSPRSPGGATGCTIAYFPRRDSLSFLSLLSQRR